MADLTIQSPPAGTGIAADGSVTDPKLGATGESTLILGKFKNQEELEKAYTEAQKKITELGQSKPQINLTADTAKVASVDLDALAKEYADNGDKLKPETLEDLEKKGFSKQVVDNYILGQKARAEKFAEDLASVAGGTDGLMTVLSWAKTGLTKSEQEAYNAAYYSQNVDATKMLLRDIVSKFFQANGKAPALVNGEKVPPGGGEKYDSYAQVTEDMRNPKYKKDEAFRQKVQDKLSRSAFTVGR